MDNQSCSMKGNCKGFNFSFWAKMLVAIPALPIIGLVAGSFFVEPWLQFIAAGLAMAASIWVALKIERKFSKPIKNK